MTRLGRTGRIGLLLAYAAITVWVQAGHVHGHRDASEAESQAQCLSGCADPRPHYSGHPSVDLGRIASDCPACQLRSGLHVWTPTALAVDGTVVAAPARPGPIRPDAAPARLPTCRGPPLA